MSTAQIPYQSYSQHNIDIQLAEIFKKRDGFFIEAGANDGINQSNTFLLEHFFGWRGLLVEPNPIEFVKCKLNRIDSIVEFCALVSDEYPEKTIKGDFIADTVDASMTGGCTQYHSGDTLVPAAPLSKLLDRYHIDRVDLFSLDVEGYEMEVLKGLNLNRHRPDYILFELHDVKYSENPTTFLERMGYRITTEFTDRHLLFKSDSISS
ncbi:MAG: FkbM family methyltransferase [Bdellovibrionales bacterium]|nr:FkbM family methyltransferase [Bdellovibrionales bacterium]